MEGQITFTKEFMDFIRVHQNNKASAPADQETKPIKKQIINTGYVSQDLELSSEEGLDPFLSPKSVDIICDYIKNEMSSQYGYSNLMLVCFILLSITTGRRPADLLKFKLGDVLNEDGSFKSHHIIKEGKTQKTVRIVYPQIFVEELNNYLSLAYQQEELDLNYPLFPNYRSIKNGAPKPVGIRGLQSTIKKVIQVVRPRLPEEDKNSKLGLYSLRKSYARWNYEKDPHNANNLREIQYALNHSKEDITVRYAKIPQGEAGKCGTYVASQLGRYLEKPESATYAYPDK